METGSLGGEHVPEEGVLGASQAVATLPGEIPRVGKIKRRIDWHMVAATTCEVGTGIVGEYPRGGKMVMGNPSATNPACRHGGVPN